MTVRLSVSRVRSANRLRRACTDPAAHGEWDASARVLVVDSEDTADELVGEYPNVERVDAPDRQPETPRVELDSGERTYRCGVNDCSREVDSADDTCWQHS